MSSSFFYLSKLWSFFLFLTSVYISNYSSHKKEQVCSHKEGGGGGGEERENPRKLRKPEMQSRFSTNIEFSSKRIYRQIIGPKAVEN